MTDPSGRRHVHVPGPGDVLSPQNRSAVLTVARQLAEAHERNGGRAALVAARGAVAEDWDGPPVLLGGARMPSSRVTRTADLMAGRAVGVRPLTLRAYRHIPTTPSDLVFLHAHPAAALSRRVAGTKVVYAHNDAFRLLGAREVRAIGRSAAAVVSVSADLASRFPTLSCPVLVVPNGADTSHFHPAGDRSPGPRPRVAFLGRVVPEKGVHVLLEAASSIRHLDFTVDVIGSSGGASLSPYERALRATASPMGERVRFIRDMPRSAIGEHLRGCDVLVVPSVWQEPLGLVVAEGIASGLAVIASRTGGIPEVGGDACRYVRPDSVGDLAGALEEMVGDPMVVEHWQRRSLARAPEVSWDASYRRLLSALREAGL